MAIRITNDDMKSILAVFAFFKLREQYEGFCVEEEMNTAMNQIRSICAHYFTDGSTFDDYILDIRGKQFIPRNRDSFRPELEIKHWELKKFDVTPTGDRVLVEVMTGGDKEQTQVYVGENIQQFLS